MTAETLVAVLEQGGIRLRAEGEKLKLEAPADRVPSPETLGELREKKAAVLEYLRGRHREIQFPSFTSPRVRKTDKLKSCPDATSRSLADRRAAACSSPHCAGCYEVEHGVRIHPPKCGEDYRAWLERWEAKGRVQ